MEVMLKKKLSWLIFAILLVMAFQGIAIAGIWITDVNVVPAQPSMTDVITLNIKGGAPETPSWVVYEEFSQDGTSFLLDLHIGRGGSLAISYWSYFAQIQPLPPATYTLQVRAFDNYYGTLDDTHIVNFIVTPEPATLAFLTLGLPLFRILSRRKRLNRR
jgi:hypothetical protein